MSETKVLLRYSPLREVKEVSAEMSETNVSLRNSQFREVKEVSGEMSETDVFLSMSLWSDLLTRAKAGVRTDRVELFSRSIVYLRYR